MIYTFTFILAFCSIAYELLLGQSLSAFLGNTVLRYSVTIGLYMLSTGIGAMFAEGKLVKRPMITLLKIELLLTVTGGFSVILLLVLNSAPLPGIIFFTDGSSAHHRDLHGIRDPSPLPPPERRPGMIHLQRGLRRPGIGMTRLREHDRRQPRHRAAELVGLQRLLRRRCLGGVLLDSDLDPQHRCLTTGPFGSSSARGPREGRLRPR